MYVVYYLSANCWRTACAGGDLLGEPPPHQQHLAGCTSRCHLPVCLLIFLQFARVLQKIRETVVIGFLEDYPFWFAVDFVKRFVFAAVIIYEKDSEVPKHNTPVCVQTSTHRYVHAHRQTVTLHTHAHTCIQCILTQLCVCVHSCSLSPPTPSLLFPSPPPTSSPPPPPSPAAPAPSLSTPQVAAIFVITLYICLYAYLRPYKMLTDNIFELLLLVNLFALMMLRSVAFVRDVLSDLVVSPDPTHCSGWTVVNPSYVAIVLGILYYLPVFYTAMPITVAILRFYRYAH